MNEKSKKQEEEPKETLEERDKREWARMERLMSYHERTKHLDRHLQNALKKHGISEHPDPDNCPDWMK